MKGDTVTRGSGNVFADLGLPDADAHLLKAHVVIAITDMIDQQGLSQTAAASRMGIAQPDLSKLLRGQFRGFSLERLLDLARALGGDIEIKVKRARKEREGSLKLELI